MWMIKDRKTDSIIQKGYQSRHEAQTHADILDAADGSTYVKWYDETTVQKRDSTGLVIRSDRKRVK